MAAAALDWIHDNIMDQQFADRWNNATLATRAKLLKDASRDPYQKHLAWEAMQPLVRADVTYAIKRQDKKDQELEEAVKAEAAKRVTHHHPIAANDPRLWWNRD